MIDAIAYWHITDIKRVDALQAADVVTVFLRIGSALMMRVDTAPRAEIMFGGPGVEFVALQVFLTLDYVNSRQRNGSDDGAFSAADRAIAAAWINDSVRKMQTQDNGAAMTGRGVPFVDLGGSDLFNHEGLVNSNVPVVLRGTRPSRTGG